MMKDLIINKNNALIRRNFVKIEFHINDNDAVDILKDRLFF